MTTKEFQDQVIDTCKQQNACANQFKLLLSAMDRPALFLQVLRNNHRWCVENAIYTPDLLLQLDVELLLRGGYATQDTKSVSFQPVEIGDNTWSAFNYGGSFECINGSYHNFDEALTLDYDKDWRQPLMLETYSLTSAPHMLGIYANTFGYILKGVTDHLFIPASGHRNASDGTLYWVGIYSYLWSLTAYDNHNGFNLYINESNGVRSDDWNNHNYCFPVRCVLK